MLLLEQFLKQEDVLHLHVVSSRRLSRAGAFVISNGKRCFSCFSLVTQDLASLQERASRRRPGSLIALDVEVDNQTSVEAFSFSAFSGRT